MGHSGAGGTDSWKKPEAKNRDTVPLSQPKLALTAKNTLFAL